MIVADGEFAAPGGGNSTVESHSSKVMVAGSNPVPRSNVFEVGGNAEDLTQKAEEYG